MGERQPKIRQKTSGGWYIRWGGRDRYLSMDRNKAERLLLDPDCPNSLVAWRRWRDQRETARSARSSRRVAEIAELMLENYRTAGRDDGYLRRHLRRFLNLWGTTPIAEICSPDLARGVYQPPIVGILTDLQDDLKRMGLASKTINHDVGAVKTMFRWAARKGYAPSVPFDLVRTLPTSPGDPVELEPRAIRLLVRAVERVEPELARHWSINYLTMCRPSETIRIVAVAAGLRDGLAPADAGGAWSPIVRDGTRVAGGRLLELFEHKTAHHAQRRRVIVTDECRRHIESARPRWSRLDSYSAFSRRHGVAPSWLRDSAANHLRSGGVAEADVDLLLGHARDAELGFLFVSGGFTLP